MALSISTPIVAGNGPSAFRGTLADIFTAVGRSVTGRLSVIDFEDGSLEVQADESDDFLEVTYDEMPDGGVRILKVYVGLAAETVCF